MGFLMDSITMGQAASERIYQRKKNRELKAKIYQHLAELTTRWKLPFPSAFETSYGDRPKISIVIPVHNAGLYIGECLESLIRQSFYDMEIICVDDGSADDSVSLIRDYARYDERIKLVQHDQQKGISASRNSGIKSASGTYLFFIDADDALFNQNVLDHLYQIADRHGADEVIGIAYKWDSTKQEIFFDHTDKIHKGSKKITHFLKMPGLRSNVVVWNKLIKRSFLIDNDLLFFDERIARFEDNHYSWKIHVLAKKIGLATEPGYLYRQPSEGDYFYLKMLPHMESQALALEETSRFFDTNPSRTAKQRSQVEKAYANFFIRAVNKTRKFEDMDKKRRLDLCRRYCAIWGRLPQKSFRALPVSAQKAFQLFQQERYEEGLDCIYQKNEGANKKEEVARESVKKLSSTEARFASKEEMTHLHIRHLCEESAKLSTVLRQLESPIAKIFFLMAEYARSLAKY